ncbi:MAG: peptidoglycan DD-metalloendopeptidase family protein [bacterium]|nr:peptidoglycan DD-metalloendopeptidase family protein [bacterium]
MKFSRVMFLLFVAGLGLLLAACSQSNSTLSNAATPASSQTVTESPGPSTPSSTPTVKPTAQATAKPTNIPTAIPAATPTVTPEGGTSEAGTSEGGTSEAAVLVLNEEPLGYADALAVARLLAPNMVLPSDCDNPLPRPDLLPNAPRPYRSGIHQGVDFMCPSLGHFASAVLDGRVVQMVNNYIDPTPAHRQQMLDIAKELGTTPPFTLLSLYGNYVVIDHGVLPVIGHLVSVYAHLHEVDHDLSVGQSISAGDRVGEIGNKGTSAAARGDYSEGAHLHWELHINNQYLGAGLSTTQTRRVYTELFSEAMG